LTNLLLYQDGEGTPVANLMAGERVAYICRDAKGRGMILSLVVTRFLFTTSAFMGIVKGTGWFSDSAKKQ